MPPDTI